MLTHEDRKFLDSFETCALGATCWTHEAHVRIGWSILTTSDTFDAALSRLRSGIMKFNASKNSIGYHETITVAFARIIDSRRQSNESWQDFSERNSDLFDKTCIGRHYSRELLASEQARSQFMDADLAALPELRIFTTKICDHGGGKTLTSICAPGDLFKSS